ncbi:MAG TPA: BatA domain-containing protein, partial [Pirellulales bacterium]
MGLLAPLFLAGLAALSVPLVLHLIRRTPRGRQDFSSLMFLTPTPPRLTRRSRLDQVLLLLLRLAALAALALAFSRPFLRESSLLSLNDLPRRRVVVLVDQSASMRRGDLWNQAITAANKELDDLAPHDEVALYAFSDRLEKLVGFDAHTPGVNVVAADVVRQALAALQPNWSAGDLGAALTTLAGELDASGDHAESPADPQLVVVSDFQNGSRIEALQN